MKKSAPRTGASSRSPHAARTPSPSSADRTPDTGGNDVKKVLRRLHPASLHILSLLRVVFDDRTPKPCNAFRDVQGMCGVHAECVRVYVCVPAIAAFCVQMLAGARV